MKKTFLFIARALFSLIFIVAGVSKFFSWSDTVEDLVTTFCHWHMRIEGATFSNDFLQLCISAAPLLIGLAMCLEIIGGLLILLNIKMRLGALLLLIILIPITVLYHSFWFELGDAFHIQMAMFMKNLSIMGALLYFVIGSQPKKTAS